MGYFPESEGMFYEEIYYYSSNPEAPENTPDYVLIWTSIGAVADEVFEVNIGDYVLNCPGHCYPYNPGYYIYVPAEDELITIEDAYRKRLDGLKTVFEEAPVFRPVSVDFNVIIKERIDYYGSEETELYLLHHGSCEEEVTSKFTDGGWYDVPELNLPKDENGFYTDGKIYIASFNVVGGGNASQYITRVTVKDGNLELHRVINTPELATPDMYYEFMLIEIDESLWYSIDRLWDITEYD